MVSSGKRTESDANTYNDPFVKKLSNTMSDKPMRVDLDDAGMSDDCCTV